LLSSSSSSSSSLLDVSNCVGKSGLSASLSEHYDIPVLTVDDVIIASLSSSSVAGARARQLCAEAGRRLTADECRTAAAPAAGDDDLLAHQRAALGNDATSAHTLGTHTCTLNYSLSLSLSLSLACVTNSVFRPFDCLSKVIKVTVM